MGTTANGLPYPEGTDPVSAGDDAIKALALALDPWAKDTGWVALTLATGTGAVKYRQLGKVMFIVVDATVTTVSSTAVTLVAAGGIPAGLRPTVSSSIRAFGYFAGWPGTIWAGSGGDVQAIQTSGANRANIGGVIIYPLG